MVAQKVARNYDVLRPESVYKFWVSGIPKLPCYPFPEPRLNYGVIALPIEHFSLFSFREPLKE